MQSLATNPSGKSSIYGQPQQMDVMGIVNQLRDRDERDFMNRANFMSDLSLKQDRLRRIYDLQDKRDYPPEPQQGQPQAMNTVMGRDPNAMTGYERGELGVRQQQLGLGQQQLGLDRAKLAQQGELGEQALNIKSAQEQLNEQKSDQINAIKQADLERKIKQSEDNISIAQAKLQQAGDNFNARLEATREYQKAMGEYHKAEMERKQHEFDVTSEQHNQTIKRLEDQLKQSGRTKTTTEINPEGTQKTVTTTKGSAADTVKVVGKDGKTYEIPRDKLDEWNKQHSGSEQENQQDQEED